MRRPDSWIILDRTTGKAVRELYQAANVARINGARYVAVTASAYLASINGQGGASLDLTRKA